MKDWKIESRKFHLTVRAVPSEVPYNYSKLIVRHDGDEILTVNTEEEFKLLIKTMKAAAEYLGWKD